MSLQLNTDRLHISELSESDATFMLRLLNSPSWIKHIGDRGVKTIKQAADYIRDGAQSSYGTNGYGLWKVALHSGEPIGICGLVKRDYLDDVDLGFGYLPEYQGQGYGYEAAKAVVDHATLSLGIGKLVAITTEQNIGSISLLSKLEFKPEGTVIYPGTEEELLLFNRIS